MSNTLHTQEKILSFYEILRKKRHLFHWTVTLKKLMKMSVSYSLWLICWFKARVGSFSKNGLQLKSAMGSPFLYKNEKSSLLLTMSRCFIEFIYFLIQCIVVIYNVFRDNKKYLRRYILQ